MSFAELYYNGISKDNNNDSVINEDENNKNRKVTD